MSNAHTIELAVSLSKLGFAAHEISALRRIARALSRWCELECGNSNAYASWAIERDDETDKPYFVTYPYTGEPYRRLIQDKEKSSLARLDKIIAAHPELVHYYQTDPRGASLYILSKAGLGDRRIDSVYTDGVAVY